MNGSISIPNNFYKIIVARDKLANLKAIAFLIPNEPSKHALSTYLITIDDLEKLTKIDFCYKLPESVESKLESEKADLNFWEVK